MICKLLLISCLLVSGIRAQEDEEHMTTLELIKKYGYPAEAHSVITEDGYILELHRIPYSPESPQADNKPVVFLQHGLFSSSADWIILGPGVSLGYLLADAGYDVWMGNARGNTYSKKHQTLDTSSSEFWDFSWHEMGVYDLPAVIDQVLATTGQSDIFYIGHSMGTTMFYVLESEKPEYVSKVRHEISMAPIAYMEHVTNFLAELGSLFPGILLGEGLELFGVGDLFESNDFTTTIMDLLCADDSLAQGTCMSVMFALIGYDPIQVNETMLPVILAHTPAGASTKTVVHYAQEIGTIPHDFYKWNYYLLNIVEYGNLLEPDTYNINNVRTPGTLMYCDNDPFADPTDVLTLNGKLPNVKELYEVALKTCNHQDFLWAKDVKVLVNDEVLRIVKENSS